MDKFVSNPWNPSKSPSSHEIEMVDLSQESPANNIANEQEIIKRLSCGANQLEALAIIPSKKSIFEEWTNTFVMVPFTIITNLFTALWAVNGNGQFAVSRSTCHIFFFFLVMINFYASIVGILLWRVYPKVARGIHLIAFVCALLSLTLLFSALLPCELKGVPWIFMAIVLLIVVGLLVYELSLLSKKSS
ncbi:uncharacterized protein LOC110670797 [Hevea brasiliensis]|uniref:uncharacterized protein LOC110670797 n=1 Tax=Hevea brasiliensis TaxID=3981 RepID=UPI0025E6B1CD|nr:uncharacterized protein LOC110670797 [Hevea brasiliensis]